MQYNNFTWIICLFANCLLIYLTQLVNHSLAVVSLPLFTLGLTLIFPVLYLPYLQGLIATLITALFFDSTESTVSFGVSYYILGIAFTTIYCIYHHFKLYSALHTVLLIQFTNLSLIIIYHLILNFENGFNPHLFYKLFQVIIASKIVLLLTSTWFLNLQATLFHTFSFYHPSTKKRPLSSK